MNKMSLGITCKVKQEEFSEILHAGKTQNKGFIIAGNSEVKTGYDEESKITGVVIGEIAFVDEAGKVYVDYYLNPSGKASPAASVYGFTGQDAGRKVALIFQDGNPNHPFIIGPVIDDESSSLYKPDLQGPKKPEAGKEVITLTAMDKIILTCGKASITLTSAGKIIIRGKYLLSRSSGVNSIKGGSVQIN